MGGDGCALWWVKWQSPRVLWIYCWVSIPKTDWLKTAVCHYLSWFCGLNELTWVVLIWCLLVFSQLEARAGVSESPIGLDVQRVHSHAHKCCWLSGGSSAGLLIEILTHGLSRWLSLSTAWWLSSEREGPKTECTKRRGTEAASTV